MLAWITTEPSSDKTGRKVVMCAITATIYECSSSNKNVM